MNVLGALLLACTLGFLALPLAADAEPAEKVYRIGFLNTRGVVPNPLGPNPAYREFDAFLQGMRELGYVVGQNLVIEIRGAEAAYDRLPGFAADLVNLKLELIVTPTTAAARAVKNATSTIPVVVISAGDPVGDGLIASLARPGGNVTGLTSSSEDLTGKRLQLLKEAEGYADRCSRGCRLVSNGPAAEGDASGGPGAGAGGATGIGAQS